MYVVVPHTDISHAVNTFTQHDLEKQIHFIYLTARASVDDLPDSRMDTALTFNVEVWKNHYISLCEYGLQMIERFDKLQQSDSPEESHYGYDLEGYHQRLTNTMLAWEVDLTQAFNLPRWTGNPTVIEAHRRYLLNTAHDPEPYKDLWPDLTPLSVPVPAQGGVEAYQVSL